MENNTRMHNNANLSFTKTNLNNPDFAKIDRIILSYWQENKIFEQSIENRKKQTKDQFTFYDGPPFANGLPHYGHLLTGYLKDVYCRYQTMKGKIVERRFGWDCHGLPAEMQAEKELGISGKLAIQEYGVEKFNNHCKTSVMRYVNEWQEYVLRQGRWVDFENSYKTMDLNFMESVMWGFKQLYDKGYVYESVKILPYSYACQTPLSNFETRLDNSYREVTDKTVTVAFELDLKKEDIFLQNLMHQFNLNRISILAWTTTPWTLPSNLALAINKDLNYLLITNETNSADAYIIESTLLNKYQDIIGSNIIANFTGAILVGINYKPLLPYFEQLKNEHHNCFTILHGDFVSSGSGTGCVHIAPGFGEEDFELCKKFNIPIKCPINNAGEFTSEVKDLEGINVFKTIDTIIAKLKQKQSCIKIESYKHNYPHCWRTDTPLIYRAVSSFYVKVTSFKDRMIELNKNINWIPSHIKDNLFGKWLENAKDWAISRNRFWGTCIPVWKSNDPTYPRIDVYGSIKELEKDFNVKIDNLHKEHLDKLTRVNPDDPTGKSLMVRCEDVFDCWFESGSMPFAQKHYPFSSFDDFTSNFPADFIVEYAAQTRGWFYTLMVLSVGIFDRYPFKNCIAHGVVLDQTGQKLSKRLNNYQPPFAVFDQFGSDAVRLTMLGSSVCRGLDLKLDAKGEMISESIKNIIKPLYNTVHFLDIYQTADSIETKINFNNISNILNQYILIKLKSFAKEMDKSLSNFDTVSAVLAMSKFMEILTNWYIRRSREVFWQSEKTDHKQESYNTLYTVIVNFCIICAPLMPFSAEYIYMILTNQKSSVHLQDYPIIDHLILKSEKKEEELIELLDSGIEICSLVLCLRNKLNIKIRQPLQKIQIGFIESKINLTDIASIIKDEINIKEIEVLDNFEHLAERVLTLNFPLIGKRIPGSVKNLINAQKNNSSWILNKHNQTLEIDGIILQKDEYSLFYKTLNENIIITNQFLIMLNTEITEELKTEGIARDIVRSLQNIRKELNLNINDSIKVEIISLLNDASNSWNQYFDYIKTQCLLSDDTNFKLNKIFNLEINSQEFTIKVHYNA